MFGLNLVSYAAVFIEFQLVLKLTVSILMTTFGSYSRARFKRRTLHVPNLMQISKNNSFCSFALGSAHGKFGV